MTKLISNAAIRRAWLDGALTLRQAAASVGLSGTNFALRARAIGLTRRKKGGIRFTFDDPHFSEFWRAGVLAADIAAHFGGAATSVGEAARRRGLPPRALGRRPVIRLQDYLARRGDELLAARMAAAARQEAQALRLAQMVDQVHRPHHRRRAASAAAA